MSLGNTYVVTGDIWEASLLYSQVEKDFKFEEIGDLAKFKNAKVFYFDGEFEYAQSQLDVLKGSTSKLISNDAIQLAIIISDNFGLDSNYQVMNWYANAELLIEQHKFDEAISLFDSISTSFPNHGLGDEILYQKGKIMESIGKWESACNYYNSLISNYGFDIMADDAMFRLGMIQEKQLNKPQEAIATYKKIMLNYKDSLFCSEARKRVRLLRGDFISDPDL
jgi:tetratricopeptide (TPR) repeat protein